MYKEEIVDNYPYNPMTSDLDVRIVNQTIYHLVIRKFNAGGLILSPNYQRQFIWSIEKMSLFIESIILNFPLPPLYINQDINGNYIVLDGKQRITTLRKYFDDEFELKGLNILKELNGKKFSDLSGVIQSKIEDKALSLYIIKPSVPLKVVYDIFYRINTKGIQLNHQELRNGIFAGKANELLYDLSKEKYFRKAIDNGISSKRMRDQEAILRYLSFQIFDYQDYSHDSFSDFLDEMMEKINTFDDEDIQNLKSNFQRVMLRTLEFFGKENFRFPRKKKRGIINLALFETISYFFSKRSDDFLQKNKLKIQQNYKILLNDEVYRNAVKGGTGNKVNIITRFNRVQEILGKID